MIEMKRFCTKRNKQFLNENKNKRYKLSLIIDLNYKFKSYI